MKSRLLTLDQVAERLQIRKSWFYQRIHSRTLPFRHCKIGQYSAASWKMTWSGSSRSSSQETIGMTSRESRKFDDENL